MITGQSSYQEIRYLYLHRTFVAVQMFQRRMRRGVRERERENILGHFVKVQRKGKNLIL